jgi:uncharacterized Zn-binding protein involved in type VI secretion
MPAIARVGDTVLSVDGSGYRCSQPMETTVGEANTLNVRANGKAIAVFGSKVAPHPKNQGNGCGVDVSTLSTSSGRVKIGGKGVGRIGDDYGGVNLITQGSSNVLAA